MPRRKMLPVSGTAPASASLSPGKSFAGAGDDSVAVAVVKIIRGLFVVDEKTRAEPRRSPRHLRQRKARLGASKRAAVR